MSFYSAGEYVRKNFAAYVKTACAATVPQGTLPVFGVVVDSQLPAVESWPNRKYGWDWSAILAKHAGHDGVFEFAVYDDTTLCGLVLAIANHAVELPGGNQKASWLKAYAFEVQQNNPLSAAAHKWLLWALTYYAAACGVESVEFADSKLRGWRVKETARKLIVGTSVKKRKLTTL